MTMLGCIYDLLSLLHFGKHTRVHQNRVRGQGSKTTGTSFTSYITASRTPSRPRSFPRTPSPGLALTYSLCEFLIPLVFPTQSKRLFSLDNTQQELPFRPSVDLSIGHRLAVRAPT